MKKRLALGFVVSLFCGSGLFIACSSASNGSDGGADDGGGGDGSTDGSANQDSSSDGNVTVQCDTGTAPANLPQVTSAFFFGPPTVDGGADGGDAGHDGGDAGTNTDACGGGTPAPGASGGDPTGTWVFTNVDVYLPQAASSIVQANTSTATGTGWLSFTGSSFVQVANVTVTASVSGFSQNTPFQASATGTYTECAAELAFNASCNAFPSEFSGATFSFSRVSATHLVLYVISAAPFPLSGTVYIVIDMKPSTT